LGSFQGKRKKILLCKLTVEVRIDFVAKRAMPTRSISLRKAGLDMDSLPSNRVSPRRHGKKVESADRDMDAQHQAEGHLDEGSFERTKTEAPQLPELGAKPLRWTLEIKLKTSLVRLAVAGPR
jgi:hypothetical protein